MPMLAQTIRRTLFLAAASTVLGNVVALAAKPEKREEHLYLSEQIVYDDNLFRLQDGTTTITDSTDPDAATREISREDYSNRVTLGLGNDFQMGRHRLRLNGRVYDARFNENDYLDYTGGDATAQFDFRMLTAFSGRLSGGYGRTLADFANTRGSARDLIDTTNYSAMLRYEIGPRWSISASGGRVATDHDLDSRQDENLQADMARASIDYSTPSLHSFGVEYRYIDATFPDATRNANGDTASDYEEKAAIARFTYTPTVRTQIRLNGGYVERTRPADEEGDYSGETWRAEIDWKPREKFSTLLAAWRDLRAYSDVESDYYVSEGYSLGPTWSPTEKLSFALTVSYEDQEYLTNRTVDTEDGTRNDDLLSGLFTITYRPREQLAFELSYRGNNRDSNRDDRRYDAQNAGLSIRWSVF